MTMESLVYSDEIQQRLSIYPDANNNGEKVNIRGDKYSLRPRGSNRKGDDDLEGCVVVSKRSRKEKKEKQKPAPLSKYRRKTANARERSRMREINAAFEALRRCVPHMQAQTHIPSPCHASSAANAASEKLTKITTLRLAMKYISALSAALSSPVGLNSAPGTTSQQDLQDLLSDCSDLDCLLLESDGESLPLSDHSLLASPEFSDPGLSPCTLEDPSLPSLLHTDFSDNTLTSTEFSDFFLT